MCLHGPWQSIKQTFYACHYSAHHSSSHTGSWWIHQPCLGHFFNLMICVLNLSKYTVQQMVTYVTHSIYILYCKDKTWIHFLLYGCHIAGGSWQYLISAAQKWHAACHRAELTLTQTVILHSREQLLSCQCSTACLGWFTMRRIILSWTLLNATSKANETCCDSGGFASLILCSRVLSHELQW